MPFKSLCKDSLRKKVFENLVEQINTQDDSETLKQEREDFRKTREDSKLEYLNFTQDNSSIDSFTPEKPLNLGYDNFHDYFIEKIPTSYENNKLNDLKEVVDGQCSFPKLVRSKSNIKKRINVSSKNDTFDTPEFYSSPIVNGTFDFSLDLSQLMKQLDEELVIAKDTSQKFVEQFSCIDLVKTKVMKESDSEKFSCTIKDVSKSLGNLRQFHEDSKTIEEFVKKIAETKQTPSKSKNSLYKDLANEVIVGMEEMHQLVKEISTHEEQCN